MNAWRSVWVRSAWRSRPGGQPGAHDPPRAVPVPAPPAGGQEDGPFSALADGQVDRPGGARFERDGDHLAALARDYEGAVPALDTQGLDVGAGCLGDP